MAVPSVMSGGDCRQALHLFTPAQCHEPGHMRSSATPAAPSNAQQPGWLALRRAGPGARRAVHAARWPYDPHSSRKPAWLVDPVPGIPASVGMQNS